MAAVPGVDDVAQKRQTIITLLEERGVTGAEGIVGDLEDDQLTGALGAIARFDDQRTSRYTPPIGGLVTTIRQGGLPGYRRPDERTSVDGVAGAQTDEVMNLIRGKGLSYSPFSGTSREMLREAIKATARRLQSPPDALIDTAMHPAWSYTPPWPGVLWHPGDDPELHGFRYRTLCGLPKRPSVGFPQREGETDVAFAYRFWNVEPPEAVEAFKQQRAQAAARAERERREYAAAQAELAAKRARRVDNPSGTVEQQGTGADSPPASVAPQADHPELPAAPAASGCANPQCTDGCWQCKPSGGKPSSSTPEGPATDDEVPWC